MNQIAHIMSSGKMNLPGQCNIGQAYAFVELTFVWLNESYESHFRFIVASGHPFLTTESTVKINK